MELKTGDKIDVSCTWGDGPDVCVNIHGDTVKRTGFLDGICPVDLTGEEAVVIGKMLIQAGKEAKELDSSYSHYMNNNP